MVSDSATSRRFYIALRGGCHRFFDGEQPDFRNLPRGFPGQNGRFVPQLASGMFMFD
ncbi:MAG: hypothetical protein R3C26_18880 [Calditrichia bacterium]